MAVLPLELTEIIIDILAQNDDQNLSSIKACALVCYGFLHLCRKYIFASITLNDNDNRAPPLQSFSCTTPMLHQLLSITPEIADYIQNLYYHKTANDLKDVSLVKTFKKISHLKILVIYSLQWHDNFIRPALLHLMHFPTLTSLKLFGVRNFDITELAPCINLKHFEFSEVTVSDTNETSLSNLPDSSISLSNIVAGSDSALAILSMCAVRRADQKPFIDFDCLNDLTVTIQEPNDVPALRTLLSHCKELTRVNVDIDVWYSRAVVNLKQIGLSKMLYPTMKTLKHLLVENIFEQDIAGSDNDPLAGLTFELEVMKNNNIIETIDIEIYIDMDLDCTRGDEWGRLDKALASGWPMLERVSLMITIWSFSRSDDLESVLKKLPQTQFPKLSSNESLAFEFTVYNQYV